MATNVPTDENLRPIPTPAWAPVTPTVQGPPIPTDEFGTKLGTPGFDPNSTARANIAAAVEASRPKISNDPTAPAFPVGPPPIVGQFINEGGAQGMGHFATQEDVQAHHDAFSAAKQYADLAQHFHTLHNETQQHLDTGGAFQELTGFNSAHPDAEAQLAAIRAKYPNARPEAFQYAEKALAARQGVQGKLTIEQQKAVNRITAKAAAEEDLQKSYGITPTELLNATDLGAGNMVHTTVADKSGNPVQKSEFVPDEKGSVYRFYSHKGEPIFMAKDTYDKLRAAHSTTPPAPAKGPSAEFTATKTGTQIPASEVVVNHAEALKWANEHPKDSRAAEIIRRATSP